MNSRWKFKYIFLFYIAYKRINNKSIFIDLSHCQGRLHLDQKVINCVFKKFSRVKAQPSCTGSILRDFCFFVINNVNIQNNGYKFLRSIGTVKYFQILKICEFSLLHACRFLQYSPQKYGRTAWLQWLKGRSIEN